MEIQIHSDLVTAADSVCQCHGNKPFTEWRPSRAEIEGEDLGVWSIRWFKSNTEYVKAVFHSDQLVLEHCRYDDQNEEEKIEVSVTRNIWTSNLFRDLGAYYDHLGSFIAHIESKQERWKAHEDREANFDVWLMEKLGSWSRPADRLAHSMGVSDHRVKASLKRLHDAGKVRRIAAIDKKDGVLWRRVRA